MADAAAPAPVVFKKRAGRANIKKRAATPPPSDSDDSSYSSEDETGQRVKRRRKGGLVATSNLSKPQKDLSKSTQFQGDRTATVTQTDDATKTSNWYHSDTPARPTAATDPSNQGDGTYKGTSNYTSFIQKNPDKAAAATAASTTAPQKSVGPVKAASNVRQITLIDYAPDSCKDYRLTGFCGFGDSCKFLHDREIVQQGWQLDKEWEKVTKGKTLQGTVVASANRGGNGNGNGDNANPEDAADEAEAAELEKIPFACIICKEPYKNPVVTKCGHYFCEACALKRHKSKGGKQCAACGQDTGGTFNVAKNLRKLLEKKKERIRKRKQRAREAGEQVSSDEDD